jgi:hypothetical protein
MTVTSGSREYETKSIMEPEDQLLTTPLDEAPLEPDDFHTETGDDIQGQSEVDWPMRPPSDVSSFDDQSLIAELQRRGRLSGTAHAESFEPPGFASHIGVDPRLAQIVELSHSNPAMAEALRLQVAEERAEARVMERIGPTLAPIAQREAIQNSGLGSEGQQYLSQTFAQMPGIDVAALMNNPLARDVLTRAARQYEVEKSSRSAPRYESAASEAPTLSAEDWRAVREFERMTGDRVDSDVIKSARRRF